MAKHTPEKHHKKRRITRQNITLVVVVFAILLSIYYLSGQKAGPDSHAVAGELSDEEEAVAIQNTIQPAIPVDYIRDEVAIAQKEDTYLRAPDLQGIAGTLNIDHIPSLEEYRGKVVLIDFWTYSCINCIRTLPYLKGWHEAYADDGLVIIGVHTPEFEFEKDINNVRMAAEKNGIEYAIVQDNDYRTWRAFENRFWPRKYAIDIDGFIRYNRIGEGGYEATETVIKDLLQERSERMDIQLSDQEVEIDETIDVQHNLVGTPEIYFGYQFTRGNFGNPEGLQANIPIEYAIPSTLVDNDAYLEGTWMSKPDYTELVSDTGKIVLSYDAKAVNIVAGSEEGSTVTVLVDGQPLTADNEGYDDDGDIGMAQLYNLVDGSYGKHSLEIQVQGKGFRIYTFTFG